MENKMHVEMDALIHLTNEKGNEKLRYFVSNYPDFSDELRLFLGKESFESLTFAELANQPRCECVRKQRSGGVKQPVAWPHLIAKLSKEIL
jgi:hypothetical protein